MRIFSYEDTDDLSQNLVWINLERSSLSWTGTTYKSSQTSKFLYLALRVYICRNPILPELHKGNIDTSHL
ncbi:MAG: hypothetical protein ACI9FN_003854, partial [Saprospiraceae bacterium]